MVKSLVHNFTGIEAIVIITEKRVEFQYEIRSEGELLRYNITSRTFHTFVLPEQLSLPVGLAIDNNGNLWATDHGISIFYMLDTKSHNVTMFATSKASPKIYGLNESSSLPEGSNTLPYWIQKGADDGSLWFNEHHSKCFAVLKRIEWPDMVY